MNRSLVLLLAAPCLMLAQQATPVAAVAPDTVVAVIGSAKVTAREVEELLAGLPHLRPNYVKDPKAFLHQVFFLRRLAADAVKAGLDKKSPYKELLEHARTQVLMQSMMTETGNAIGIGDEESQAYFKQHQDRYVRARTKVIYIAYSLTPPPPGSQARRILNEADAKAKAEAVVKQSRAGMDFSKLVKENSEDASSVAKDGDFPAFRQADTKIPEEIRKAVFAAKAGATTDPIKLPNGYYVFRIEEMGPPPFSEIRTEVIDQMRKEKFDVWFDGIRNAYQVQVVNEAFFKQAAQ